MSNGRQHDVQKKNVQYQNALEQRSSIADCDAPIHGPLANYKNYTFFFFSNKALLGWYCMKVNVQPTMDTADKTCSNYKMHQLCIILNIQNFCNPSTLSSSFILSPTSARSEVRTQMCCGLLSGPPIEDHCPRTTHVFFLLFFLGGSSLYHLRQCAVSSHWLIHLCFYEQS